MAGDESDKGKDDLGKLYSGEEEYQRLAQQQPAPPMKPLHARTRITEEEFNTWIRPDEMLTQPAYRIEGSSERRKLMESLKAGITIAAARSAQVATSTSESILKFAIIPRKQWRGLSDDDEYLFWDQGMLIVEDRGITGYGGGPTQRYFGIRFAPTDALRDEPIVTELEGEAPERHGSTVTRRQDLPRLPDPIAEAWAAWFKSTHKGWTKESAEEAAAHMFPNHNLSRDRVRDLMGPTKMGRPSNTDG